MALYVDGVRVGQRADVTSGEATAGYWRVGGDNLDGWRQQPTSNYLTGSIDEVVDLPDGADPAARSLPSTSAVRPHLAVPAAPADAYGAAVYTDQPDLYWRLGEAVAARSPPTPARRATRATTAAPPPRAWPARSAGTANTAVTFNGIDRLRRLDGDRSPTRRPTPRRRGSRPPPPRGGKIIGFGNAATGLSSSYDRHVYMQNDGKVVFGT